MIFIKNMSKVSKEKKISNNKSTTGTGKNTPMLGLPNKTEPFKENNINSINTNRTQAKSLYKETGKNFAQLESKTLELQLQLDKLNSDIEIERNLLIEEISQLNEDLTEKKLDISNLSSENNSLVNELKGIKSSLDDKVKIGQIFISKMEKIKKEELQKKKEIEVVEKQIELAEKSQKIIERDYNRIKNLAENNKEDKESILKQELENLETNKTELENDIINLRKIIKEHKLCPKLVANLNSKLNVIINSFQFEVKKTNMIESNKVNLEEKKEKIKKDNEEKINANNRSLSYGTNIRKKVLQKMKKKNSEKNLVPNLMILHITDICNNIEAQNKRKSGDIKNINNSDYNLKQKNLFTKNEQLQLASIIPPSYLNQFKERFDVMESQRYELIDKLKNNHDKHESMLNSVKIKLNYTELKKKEQKLLNVDLNSNLAKKNVNISKLKTQINKIVREYNSWNKLLKLKSNENNKLNKYINEMEKHKNDEEIEDGKNSSRSLKEKNHKEINLEKENFNLYYDMEK